jgi:hypothetical protein
MRKPIFCNKCKQLKPQGRDIVGLGWLVCECDTPKLPKGAKLAEAKATQDLAKLALDAIKSKDPFVFKE